MTAAEPFHHSVYVVLLDDRVRERPAFRAANPDRREELPSVYVGSTGLTPEERFANHKAGIKSGHGYVREHGVRLLPELYAWLNPMPYARAVEMEKDLADDLRRQGYGVWQA